MPGLTCNACNMEFENEAERKLHYSSDWHRYNLKRKVAGVPGVTSISESGYPPDITIFRKIFDV
ncbi:hypothetical protein F2Q68_00029116 [Brassica cretica]|uniref:C2H2-type domain-containing protein n=1 Tax=Brassica cretica TaxID=69181 RepID=A0A8S9G9V9_BRACR|nr:hypothetical protein F2Q68_00029116 [Brassica cretica]